MAFSEFYVQTTGSNMNGGSDAADAAAYTSTNGNWSTTTNVFTPISGNPSASGVVVGQFASVYIDGATTPVYGARVTAVSTTTITLSSTAKWGTPPVTSTTARTIKCGGAWKGPNGAVAFPFGLMAGTATDAAGDQPRVNFKGGTNYAITVGMAQNVAGPVMWQGYTTTVGDGGRAQFDGGTNAIVLLSGTAASHSFTDLIFANNGTTGINAGVNPAGGGWIFNRCIFHDLRGEGALMATTSPYLFIECEAYNCNGSATAGGAGFSASVSTTYIRCYAHNNTGGNTDGFRANAGGGGVAYIDCVADSNTAHGFEIVSSGFGVMSRCVAYGNTWSGVQGGGSARAYISNCIFVNNLIWGVDASPMSGTSSLHMENNAYFNNTSGASTFNVLATAEFGKITLTASPFVAPSTGDFRLNRSLLVRGAGRGTFLQTGSSKTGTIEYPNVGLQHREPFGKIPSIG